MSLRVAFLASALIIAVSVSFALGRAERPMVSPVQRSLAALHFAPYPAQKVVYHVDGDPGFFNHAYLGLLKSLQHHIDAVGAENIDLRVVVQGNGLKLLVNANTDESLKSLIDRLRGEGVRFLVCRNSLMEADQPLDVFYGVAAADVVPAAVAEIAALEAQGFVYIHM